MKILLYAAGLLLALYVLVVMAAWLGQRRLMYVPDANRYEPLSLGLAGVSEYELKVVDGARLVLWRVAPQPGQPTILYFHGNAGGLATRADRIRRYMAMGLGMTMMSYRGYSGSTGAPSEANNVADAGAAHDLLIREGVRPQDIFLYGESLGSGVAVRVAAAREVGGVILDAPYTSMVDMATLTYPFLPVRPLLADRYENVAHIKEVRSPVLVLHGASDELIPVAMGRAVYAAANEPKTLIVFPDGKHTDLDEHGAVQEVVRWIGALRSRRN